MRLMIIWGSSRPSRKGGPVAYWVKSMAKQYEGFEKVDFVDLQELKLPFFDEPISPFSMKEAGVDYQNPEGKAWAERVGKAGAVVIVTPEYNHAAPAVLKNALDWVGPEWIDKPLAVVSYGGITGGVYAAQALQTVAIELGLLNVSTALFLPRSSRTFADGSEPNEITEARLEKMFGEIVRLHQKMNKEQ